MVETMRSNQWQTLRHMTTFCCWKSFFFKRF
jgi:hypothetical protein